MLKQIIATIAYAMPRYPNTGFFEKVETIWLTNPSLTKSLAVTLIG
jgi:hypothetical protein